MKRFKAHVVAGNRPWADIARATTYDLQGNHNGCLVVIYDPDECGGFRAGAMITKMEAMNMLNLCAFTPGTRLQCPGYGELVVEQRCRATREYQVFATPNFLLVPPSFPNGKCLIKVIVKG